jgi:DNA gyrase subunit B
MIKKIKIQSVKKEEKKTKEIIIENDNSYTAKDIYVLEGLEPVRKRPGMYIGSTGVDGLHHLIWEVVDNSIDEAMAGYAKNIKVEILKGNEVAITDDGRGIPVDIHAKTKKSALETVLSTLHAGGKFGGKSYKVAGGLHGVGVSVVNALSEYLRADICRDGILYTQEYSRGKAMTKLKKLGKCKQTGTKIVFKPDPEIFKEIKFDTKKILDHLRQQAYLTPEVTIKFEDNRENAKIPSYTFHFESGIITLTKYLARNCRNLTKNIFYVSQEKDDILVEVALLYADDSEGTELAFANNIHTPEGGMHLTGFRSALTRSLNDYAKEQEIFKNGSIGFTGEDTREGLIAVVSVKLKEPQFEGQTKAKLGNPEVRTAVEQVVGENFKEFLGINKEDAKRIIEKSLLSARAREAAKKARENILRKGILEGMTLPGKLADCISRKAEESELFIVEGDSAGGCFSGDTKIALLDGRNISLRQLVKEYKEGKKNYCYTIQKDGHIGISLIKNPRRTKTKTSVVKVLLDNNEEIICTPDHKFMLRNGSYKEAKNLTPADSLMPLYRKYSEIGHGITIDGYEMVFDSVKNEWIFVHLLSDKYNLQNNVYSKNDGPDRHHIDFNKLNNNPNNIIRMEKEKHMTYHRKMAEYNLHTESSKEKSRQVHKSIEYREKIKKIMNTPGMKKMLSERAKKQWKDENYKNFMAQKFLEFYNNNAEYRAKNKKNLNQVQKKYWADWQNRETQSKRIKQYFEDHPEKKKEYSELAKKQWNNLDLRNWRSEMTKKQWTEEFRKKRKISYNKTYLRKALEVLYEIYQKNNKIDKDVYNLIRKDKKDKSVIRYDTICQRFFAGDEKRLQEAVVNYNHRIKAIIPLEKKIDVYDIEIARTHNFALASGVFVHNSSKMGRNRNTQAILPLRGKILNIEKSRFDRMMSSEEIKSLIVALGTAISEDFNIDKLRYHKIVIMTDADTDGAHIRTLLLTLFFRYFRPIIDSGYLYIAQPPLYRIQKGKEFYYAYAEAEKQKVLEKIQGKTEGKGKESSKDKIRKLKLVEEGKEESILAVEESMPEGDESDMMKGISIQRYKGLGEMNPDQLWETTMDPEKRVLKQVTIEDAEEADRLFDILMGKEVLPRKKFIQAYAQKVKNLDV